MHINNNIENTQQSQGTGRLADVLRHVMYRTILAFCISLFFLSCKNENYEEIIKHSKNPNVDMVFYAVVKAELNDNPSIEIVDRANIERLSTSTSENLFWDQQLFPKSNFINKDTLICSLKNIEKYSEFTQQHKSGWIELSKPIISNKKAVINVEFFDGNNHFGVSSTYFLKKKNKKYVIVKKVINSIS